MTDVWKIAIEHTSVGLVHTRSNYCFMFSFLLQVLPLSPFSPLLASLEMAMELWMSLWTGHWLLKTVLISTSSASLPMLPRSHMGDFWTSLLVSHNKNWLVSWQAMSTTSQYVVSTVGVRKGRRVTPWESYLGVSTFFYSVVINVA